MSDIKNKDRILEAIDQLRRRKARPDIDRICNFLLRRFAVNGKDTIADLSRMVEAEIVIKVEYKGNTSYRNAAKWSRLSVYKNKESVIENNNVPETRSLLSRAFASLLVEDPDYLDFGVPGHELKKFLLEEEQCSDWTDLDAVLQREINSGYLVKLENGNYSLADHPVPSCTTNGNSNSNDIKVFKYESLNSSQFHSDTDNVIDLTDRSTLNNTSIKATDVNNRKNIHTDDAEVHVTDISATATGAINVGGFRVGVRRKRAKKVFDPSDNNIPTRKRGRPVGSTNKSKETIQNSSNKTESVGAECSICQHQGNNRRGQFEKLITCRNCSIKAHPSCIDVTERGIQTDVWQCVNCKICARCCQSAQLETTVTCSGCGDTYHLSCHTPRLADKSRNVKWFCFRCGAPKPKPSSAESESSPVNTPNNMVIASGNLTSPSTPRMSPVPDAMPASYPASTSSEDSEDQIDECVPDVSEWSMEQVVQYMEEQGHQATAFKENGIDGQSLLLLRRKDVLEGMNMKLGPALRLYRQVKQLQLRRSDSYLFWA